MRYFKLNTILILICILLANSCNFKKNDKQESENKQIAENRYKFDQSARAEVEHSIRLGLKWLLENQEENGSWQNYPAITALSVVALLRSYPDITTHSEPIQKGLKFISQCALSDGSIHMGDQANYNTAICLMALKESKDTQYNKLINKAEQYMLRLQTDEFEGSTPDSLFYGGIGCGGDDRPDLSGLNWALEALLETEENGTLLEAQAGIQKEVSNSEAKKLCFEKALVFLSRCQNLEAYNPESYSGNDGGFMYDPGRSKAGGTSSYGSMTYVGLKSLIYAGLTKDDPRVMATYNWIKNNFTVETNPRMDRQGLYYYYMSMARALNVFGQEIIIDKDGNKRIWREELANQILKVQNEEGWWQNDNGKFWENNRVLVTNYSILSLQEIIN